MRAPEQIEAEAQRVSRTFDWLYSWCRAGSSAFALGMASYFGWALMEWIYYGALQPMTALIALLILGSWWIFWWGPLQVCDVLTRRLKRLAEEYEKARTWRR